MTFRCSLCKKKFGHRASLLRHEKKHAGELFSCDICHKKVTQKATLVMHMRIHTGEKPFSCDICRKKFTFKGTLRVHMRTHTGEKPFTCDICHKKFTRNATLMEHMSIHTGKKPFSCDVCHKEFSRKSCVRQHKCKRLALGEKPFSCDNCHKNFAYKNGLDKHKCINCDVCLKNFSYKCELDRHKCKQREEEISHSSEVLWPFRCEIYPKKSLVGSVERDQKIYNGEEHFVCDICNEKFTKKLNLEKHKKIHVPKKLLSCETRTIVYTGASGYDVSRNKNFAQKTHLEKSKQTRVSKKLFSCEFCLKNFAYEVSLQLHKQVHHEGTIFVSNVGEKSIADSTRGVLETTVSGDKRYEENDPLNLDILDIKKESDGHPEKLLSDVKVNANSLTSCQEELEFDVKVEDTEFI